MSGINLARGSSYNQFGPGSGIWALGLGSHIMLQFPLAGNLININNASHMLLIIAGALRQVPSALIAGNKWPKWPLIFIISPPQQPLFIIPPDLP